MEMDSLLRILRPRAAKISRFDADRAADGPARLRNWCPRRSWPRFGFRLAVPCAMLPVHNMVGCRARGTAKPALAAFGAHAADAGRTLAAFAWATLRGWSGDDHRLQTVHPVGGRDGAFRRQSRALRKPRSSSSTPSVGAMAPSAGCKQTQLKSSERESRGRRRW